LVPDPHCPAGRRIRSLDRHRRRALVRRPLTLLRSVRLSRPERGAALTVARGGAVVGPAFSFSTGRIDATFGTRPPAKRLSSWNYPGAPRNWRRSRGVQRARLWSRARI